MWNWIKELGLTIWALLGLIGALILVYMLIFGTCSACAQEIEEFYIPVQLSPGVKEVILVPSYDPGRFDLNNYIELSNQTGLYPNYGWTGEYYVTGVTHGEVEKFEPGVPKIDAFEIYSNETTIPEPGTLALIGVGLGFLALRRCRG